MFKKLMCSALAFVLIVGSLSACSDMDEMLGESPDVTVNDTSTESLILPFFEEMQDNEVMPYVLTEKAKVMLSQNEELFLSNSAEGLEEHTDYSLAYKVLTKNIDKHGDKLIYLPQAYVLSIDETQLDEQTVFTELHLLDEDGNSFYVMSFSAYDEIFEEDIVSVYALPLGETSFENISGGTTLAIILAGCYVEEITA